MTYHLLIAILLCITLSASTAILSVKYDLDQKLTTAKETVKDKYKSYDTDPLNSKSTLSSLSRKH